MKRRNRIGLAAAAAAASVALVVALTLLGSASEGPLSTFFGRIGTALSTAESRTIRLVRGPGRSSELAWLAPLRTHADSLRSPDTLLFGAYDDEIRSTLEDVLTLEDSLGVRFALVQIYTAWGDEPQHRFPDRMVKAIADLGSIPVVTWEPWLTAFENRAHPHLPLRDDRDRAGFEAIARGDYDFYIDAWARDAARFGRPLMLRFAHEMNDPYRYPWGPQNNEPQQFIAGWRHVVDRFRAAGAHNVVWVWSPHVAYAGYETMWPGDEYVDWVGTGALNYGTVAYWSRWWTFEEIFGQHYAFLEGFGKPLMVAEFGSLAVGGDRAEWFRRALSRFRHRFPAVHALLFFHVDDDATVTPQSVDWSFLEEPAVVAAVREALADTTTAEPGAAEPRAP